VFDTNQEVYFHQRQERRHGGSGRTQRIKAHRIYLQDVGWALGRNASSKLLNFFASGLSKAVFRRDAWTFDFCLAFSQETGQEQPRGPPTARRIVDEIGLVKGMLQRGERQTDPHALAIVELGKAAGPFLVAKLTDASPARLHTYIVTLSAIWLWRC